MTKPEAVKTEPAKAPEAAAKSAEAAAKPAETKSGGAAVMLTTGKGQGMRRLDYIRQEFAAGRKRGDIAKELGVAYQIVFAATKGTKASAPAAEAGAETEAKAA